MLAPQRTCDGKALASGQQRDYMDHMASRRTTLILHAEEDAALRAASRAEGLSQSDLIRRGIALVTAPYRRHARPTTGWLRLTRREVEALLADGFGDADV